MTFITVNSSRSISASSQPVNLFVRDVGQGKPVVLIHGWPVSHAMWEYQIAALSKQGMRVIAYDRRGFGQSDQPFGGYDYDTMADDLHSVLSTLDLQDVTLVGFSMGGGEIARYMSRHNGERVGRVAFISAVTPYLLKTEDNPDGVNKGTFDEMVHGLEKDRPDFLNSFGKKFFGVNIVRHPVSTATLDWMQSLALQASHKATVDCVRAFSATDFRQDLAHINVPTLVIHGDSDHTVPITASGERTAQMIPNAVYKVYDGAPHGLFITHKDELSADLVTFAGHPG